MTKRLRPVTLAEVREQLTTEIDPTPIRGNYVASGNDAQDKADEDEVIRRIDQGDDWAWFIARLVLTWGPFHADSVLGGCTYKDEADFRANCLPDMQAEALDELNRAIAAADRQIAKLRPLTAMERRTLASVREADDFQRRAYVDQRIGRKLADRGLVEIVPEAAGMGCLRVFRFTTMGRQIAGVLLGKASPKQARKAS